MDKNKYKYNLIAVLMKCNGMLDVVGAKMADEGQKSQAVLIAKIIKTIEDTIAFLGEEN